MAIPHELISVIGSIVGQVLHIVKKHTEEEPAASEANIFVRWILRRPANTLAAALIGMGASIGLTPADMAEGMNGITLFFQAVVTGIAANSVINRPG